MARLTEDNSTLQMALIGYQIEKDKIEIKINEIQAQLKGKKIAVAVSDPKPAGSKRYLSPAARKRIAMAQKKRWAEHRKRAAAVANEA